MSQMSLSHDEVRDLAGGFVLGALEPAEEAAVREHLRACDEPHPELAELGGVVPYLAESGDFELVEPPAALRDRIMAAAAAEASAATSAGSTAAAPPAAAPIPFPGASERAARRGRTSPLDWAFRIAAVVAIAALAGWNLLLQQDLGRAREYDNAVASVVAAAGEPGSQTVILTPAEGASARGIAAIRDDGTVVLALRDLAATSGTQVYETWLIVGDAAPVAVGGFTVGADGTGTFTTEPADAPPGAVVALTLEPNAGNTAPMGPVVASGVAVAPTS
jgi:anti-sigma-K factor RskA